MRQRFLAPALALAMIAATAPSPSKAAPEPEPSCKLPEGWSEVAAREPRFVVFGELHGTKETPAFVGNLLCALAQRGEKVLLATELSALYDDELQAAWNLPLDSFPSVLSSWDWQERKDGVASTAMFDLLTRARHLKEAGFQVGVTAFNGANGEKQASCFAHLPGQGAHEAAQAQNILDAAEAGEYTRVIVLVGGLHARKVVTTAGEFEIEPMAIRLGRMGSTLTLDHRYASGTRWGCELRRDFKPEAGRRVTRKDLSCTSHRASGWEDDGATPRLALGAFRDEPESTAYDGYFWVGPISASPPAVRDQDAD